VVGLDVELVEAVSLGFLGVEGVVVAKICCGFVVEDKSVHFGIDAGVLMGMVGVGDDSLVVGR
jgi:hypothetical protein